MKPTVYIESTVISYYAAKPSRDMIIAAHQQITHEWWENSLKNYQPYISQLVLSEIGEGDPEAALRRTDIAKAFGLLEIDSETEKVAGFYLRKIPLPVIAFRDAVHMAVASLNGMDYLITWNCRHIARGEVRTGLAKANDALDIQTPEICTPEELMED